MKPGTKPAKTWKCQVEGCTGKKPSRGGRLCDAHRVRRQRSGDVLANRPIKKGYGVGDQSRRWAGGKSKLSNGRVLIYAPDHPRASSCGLYVYRYVLVIEKKLKRFLADDEVVHHINGDFTDDRIEDLEVMTRGEHTKLHFKGRKQEKLENGKRRWSDR